MKKLTKILLFSLACASVAAPNLDAWGWRRRHHRHRSSFIVPALATGITLSAISASRASSINALRADLNNLVNTINTQNKNIEYLNNRIRDLEDRISRLERK